MVPAGVFRGEDHGRDVGKGVAIVITEVVQAEDDGNTPLPRPPHQLKAGRMPAVGEQDVGPEPVEDLPGQVKEYHRLAPVGRPLEAAGSRRHDRNPDAVERRSSTSAVRPVPISAWNRWMGSSSVASTSSSDVSRSVSRIPVVSTRQSVPRPASNSRSSRVHKAAPLEGSR